MLKLWNMNQIDIKNHFSTPSMHVSLAKREEETCGALLQGERAAISSTFISILQITASNPGPARPLQLQSVTTHRLGTGDLRVLGLQGQPYPEFLDSPAQDQGLWNWFSSNRWSKPELSQATQ